MTRRFRGAHALSRSRSKAGSAARARDGDSIALRTAGLAPNSLEGVSVADSWSECQ
jgi:hypothetical protein